MNKAKGLKEGMPVGWKIGDSILARLEMVGIKLMPEPCAEEVIPVTNLASRDGD